MNFDEKNYIRSSVTNFLSYKRYIDTDMDLLGFLSRLLRLEPPSNKMEYGQSCHKIFEYYSKTDCEVNQLPTQLDVLIPAQDATEVPVTKRIIFDNTSFLLSGRIDAIRGKTATDWKFTFSTINVENYVEDFQWKLYLYLLPSIDHFNYHSFQFSTSKKIHPPSVLHHQNVVMHRYDGLEEEIYNELREYSLFLQDLEKDNLIQFDDHKSKPGKCFEQFRDEQNKKMMIENFQNFVNSD